MSHRPFTNADIDSRIVESSSNSSHGDFPSTKSSVVDSARASTERMVARPVA